MPAHAEGHALNQIGLLVLNAIISYSFDGIIYVQDIVSINLNPFHSIERLTQNEDNKEINEYYIHELLNPSKKLSKQRRIKLISEGHQRVIWPMYNLALSALALSIFLYYPYNKKSNAKQILYAAAAVSVITYLHFALQNLASKDLSFIFACYANVIFATILSLYLFFCKNWRI